MRTLRFKPLVLSAGIKSQISWESTDGYILGLGGVAALSYEFIRKGGGVFFLEGSYLRGSQPRGGHSPLIWVKSNLGSGFAWGGIVKHSKGCTLLTKISMIR